MTQSLAIPVNESDVIRVFALNLPVADAKSLKEDPSQLAALLGLGQIDTDFAEILRFADIQEIGLEQYLHDGYDVAPHLTAQDRSKLARLESYGVILLSSAIVDRPAVLNIGPELNLIATYGLAGPDWQGDAVPPPESAAPFTTPDAAKKKVVSDAAMSGRIATLALLTLALLTALLIWIA